MTNNKKRVNPVFFKRMLAEATMMLMMGATVSCSKDTVKTNSEPTKIVAEATPTDEVSPTATVTPTPIQVVSTVKTVTRPFNEISEYGSDKHAEYDEIISLSKEDQIKYGASAGFLVEYDKVVSLKGFADLLRPSDFSREDLKASLDSNIKFMFSESDKTIILNTIDELEAHGIKIPNVALYLNLATASLHEGSAHPTTFIPETCQLFYNELEMDREEALRYLVAHCAITVYAEVDGKKILSTPSIYCLRNCANGGKEIVEIGEKFKNALVQILVSNSKGEKVKYNDPYYKDVLYFAVALNSTNNAQYTYLDYLNGGYKDFISKRTPNVLSSNNNVVALARIEGDWEYKMQAPYITKYYVGEDIYVASDNVDFLKAYGSFLPAIKNMCETVDATNTGDVSKREVMEYSVAHYVLNSKGFEMENPSGDVYITSDGTIVVQHLTPNSLVKGFSAYVDHYYKQKDKNK